MGNLKLYHCLMGYNRLDELKQLKPIHALIEYVDQTIYIDGSEGKDGTEEWLYKEFPESPIAVVHSAWSDDFPGQRTQYLDLVGSLRLPDEDSWVIVTDTDEVFSPLLSKHVRGIIDKARSMHDMVLIRCKSVTVNNKEEIIYENMDDFHKPLVFRYFPKMRYWADRSNITNNKTALHEAMDVPGLGHVWRSIPLNDQDGKLCYSHIKLENIIWERGCRNFIVFGGGPNLGEKQPLWVPFRNMLTELMGTDQYTSYDVLQRFKQGNISQEIKDFMIKYRNEEGYDGSSEVRELFLTYFILYNPNELPDDLKEEYSHLI